jgi:micrococcal nuclease
MHEYKCKILRVVDGDTVDVDIDLGFGIWMHKERVRLLGIDTPESRTRDKEEKKFGLLSKEYVKSHYPVGSMAILRTHKDKTGKFGRILGELVWEDSTINKIMVDEHYAVLYNGQSKEDIEEQHLENRKRLIEAGKI